MFELKTFDITKANNYRYTMIKNNMCFDFIVRNGKTLFLTDALPFKVFDPRLNNNKIIRCKCELDDDTFTHFIFRLKPYPDVLNYTDDMEHKTIIIQDFTKELNITTTFTPYPQYHNLQHLFIIGDESGIDFNKFK